MIRIFKKIFICILLVLTLCFVSSTGSFVYAKAMSYYNFDFSTISEEESIDFVEHHNIDIPDKIETIDYYELLNIDEATLKHIKDTYSETIKQNIPEESYSVEKNVTIKVEDTDVTTNA